MAPAALRSAPVAEPTGARVLILANSADSDSVRIARHYAERRSVPAANIIALPMPTTEVVTWAEFVPAIWEPLMAELVRAGWIDAIPMIATDEEGRRKYAVSGHRIAALVVCRGVPLKITHDPARYRAVAPMTDHAEFRTNAAAVDAELALVTQPNHPINAFVPNPLFQNEHPSAFDHAQVVLVSRLDGPTAEDAMALVDRALEAERTGLLGRAYVDLGDRDPEGNGWLESVARQLGDLGFDLSVDRAPATFPATARFDAPVLYFGWYAANVDGPFALPGFRFPPGAVAMHIHSYSATTLRSDTAGWVGPFVAKGVTATVGNVYEPYLELTHRPDLLLRALARGRTLAEAAYFALPAVSWQEIVIGDPLYRPFATTLDEQLAALARLPSRLAGYAVLRHVHRLEASGKSGDAIAELRESLRTRPNLPVALDLATRLRRTGPATGGADVLAACAAKWEGGADAWGVGREAALLLSQGGQPAAALTLWRRIFTEPGFPSEVRRVWLPDALAAARAAHDAGQAEAWESEIDAGAPIAARR